MSCEEIIVKPVKTYPGQPPLKQGPEHQWCVCAVWTDVLSTNPAMRNYNQVGWFDTSWTCQDTVSQWWPRAMACTGNPLNPLYTNNYDAFFYWIEQSILGTVVVGDQIVFDATQAHPGLPASPGFPGGVPSSEPQPTPGMCSLGGVYAVKKVCLVYRGHYFMNPQTYLTYSSLGGYTIYRGPCCDSFPIVNFKTSWDCVEIKPGQPKFGHKCIEIVGQTGQFPTKIDCENAPCSQELPQLPGTDPGLPGGIIPTL